MALTDHLFVARSRSTKIGDVPSMYIGKNESECVGSCKKSGCSLLPKRFGGKDGLQEDGTKLKPCYAWNGRVNISTKGIYRALKRGRQSNYTLQNAIAKSVRSARILRISQLGDPSSVSPEDANEIHRQCKKAGLKIKGFTAGWKWAHWWKGKLMASTMSLEQADEAIRMGWRASVVLPKDYPVEGKHGNKFTTPDGNKGVICPHMMGARLTCNTCQMCVGEKKGPIIGFFEHQ